MTPPPCLEDAAERATDRRSCGRCGHDCLGGECIDGVCQPFVLLSGLHAPIDLVANGNAVHATAGVGAANARRVWRVGREDATPIGLADEATGFAHTLALGKRSLFMAISGPSREEILFAPRDDPQAAFMPLVQASGPVADLSLGTEEASESELVYFTAKGTDGGVYEVVLKENQAGFPRRLAAEAAGKVRRVIVAGSQVFWTTGDDGGGTPALFRAPLTCDGDPGCRTLMVDGVRPQVLARVDETLILAAAQDGTILRCDVERCALASGPDPVTRIAVSGTDVFFSTESGTILASDASLADPRSIAVEQPNVAAIAASEWAVVWSTKQTLPPSGGSSGGGAVDDGAVVMMVR